MFRRINPLVLLLLLTISTVGQAVEVIAHPSVDLSSLSRSQVRSIFSMRTHSWPDGSPIRVYVLPDNNELHKQFSKRLLTVFPYKLRRIWDRNLFSGTGQIPTTVNDEAEMMRAISTTKGAIGYTNKGDVNVHTIEIR